MGQFGSKMRRMVTGYAHWCPGCEEMHVFSVESPNANAAAWKFDGNPEFPTFTPSMHIKINAPDHPHYQRDAPTSVCHYFLTRGVINFLGDCTHALKGQIIPLPPLPVHARD